MNSIPSLLWLDELENQGWSLFQIPIDECQSLKQTALSKYNSNQFKTAVLAKSQELEIRNDKTCWIESNTQILCEQKWFSQMTEKMNMIKNHFRIGLTHFETHYAIYDRGHFYKKHTDQPEINNHRFFSFVLYLNENWQPTDGGELVVYKSDHPVLKLEPKMGTLIVFKSDLWHEVLPSQSRRISITGWMRT